MTCFTYGHLTCFTYGHLTCLKLIFPKYILKFFCQFFEYVIFNFFRPYFGRSCSTVKKNCHLIRFALPQHIFSCQKSTCQYCSTGANSPGQYRQRSYTYSAPHHDHYVFESCYKRPGCPCNVLDYKSGQCRALRTTFEIAYPSCRANQARSEFQDFLN